MRIKREETAALLIDIQERLFPHIHQRDELLRKSGILIQGLKVLDVPVVITEQYPKGLGPTVPDIAELLSGQNAIAKVCFSACGQQEFIDQLRATDRSHILLAGVETHVCVYQTGRDLLQQGYTVEVAADAVASRTPGNRQTGLDKLVSLGATVTSVEMALFELLKESGTDVFKQVARLVK